MPPESIQQRKKKLRRDYRKARQELPEHQRLENNQAINEQIVGLCDERKPAGIAGYLAFDGEPDISDALSRLNAKGLNIHLPIIGAGDENNPLGFRRWAPPAMDKDPDNLKANQFGIHEPVIGSLCEVSKLDIVLVPLVAWDRQGGRLGMGAGYYDRALAGVAMLESPLRIGIAFEAQCDDSLPMDEFDIRMHGVITEKGLFTFGG